MTTLHHHQNPTHSPVRRPAVRRVMIDRPIADHPPPVGNDLYGAGVWVIRRPTLQLVGGPEAA